MTSDLILHNGRITTLDRANPEASAVSISDGKFTSVGTDNDVLSLAGPSTKIIDLKRRRVLPGLIDNHLHIIRGGLNFNMELRWDGIRSLSDAMSMLKRQLSVTPPPQWVRVVGGFTAHQFRSVLARWLYIHSDICRQPFLGNSGSRSIHGRKFVF